MTLKFKNPEIQEMIRYVSCSIARGFALRTVSIGPRQGQKLSKTNLIVQKRFNVGKNETKLSVRIAVRYFIITQF